MPRNTRLTPPKYQTHLNMQGDAIRRALAKSGITQEDASKLLLVKPATFKSWAQGRRACPWYVRSRIISELGGDVDILGPHADCCPHCGRKW